jgi:hypothetical protein
LQNALKAKSRHRREELAELAAGSPAPHPIRNDLVPKLELVERAPGDLGAPARSVRKIEAAHLREVAAACEAYPRVGATAQRGERDSIRLCDDALAYLREQSADGRRGGSAR